VPPESVGQPGGAGVALRTSLAAAQKPAVCNMTRSRGRGGSSRGSSTTKAVEPGTVAVMNRVTVPLQGPLHRKFRIGTRERAEYASMAAGTALVFRESSMPLLVEW